MTAEAACCSGTELRIMVMLLCPNMRSTMQGIHDTKHTWPRCAGYVSNWHLARSIDLVWLCRDLCISGCYRAIASRLAKTAIKTWQQEVKERDHIKSQVSRQAALELCSILAMASWNRLSYDSQKFVICVLLKYTLLRLHNVSSQPAYNAIIY